jgi:thioester reductase-like protein
VSPNYIASFDDRILVTGSNGFIGVRVVETLLEYGFRNLRCFVPRSSRLERLEEALSRVPSGKSVEFATGDLFHLMIANERPREFPLSSMLRRELINRLLKRL